MKIFSPAISRLARLRLGQIAEWVNDPVAAQREVLQELVTSAQYTSFGRQYGFNRLFNVKTPSMEQAIGLLSGGNQQKVAIARGLMTRPKVLILDEPTRGVDVGAKKEIYQLINQFKAEGLSIILVSSEMPEVLGMSDRIVVMHEGRLSGEFSREEATQESLMAAAVGKQHSEDLVV